MKTWLALAILVTVLLSVNALAVSTTITEGITTGQLNGPYDTQQSTDPVLVDSNMTQQAQQSSGDTGSINYTLETIEPEQAISENNAGVPVNGPNPSVLIPSKPSQPSEEQPSIGIPHGYITIPWWLVEFIQDNWWLLLLLIVLIIVLYIYMKHREEIGIEIEIPKWAY